MWLIAVLTCFTDVCLFLCLAISCVAYSLVRHVQKLSMLLQFTADAHQRNKQLNMMLYSVHCNCLNVQQESCAGQDWDNGSATVTSAVQILVIFK